MANQAWQITSAGVITLNDAGSKPKPGPKEVLVRVHAVSLNYRDRLVIDHSPNYPGPAKANLVPCGDGAGVVEEAGPDSVWKHGDRVIIQTNTWMFGNDDRDFKMLETLGGVEADGTLRRWMTISDERLFRAPDSLSMEEASTLYTAGLTAYRALFHGGVKVQQGTTVLTQGTGGVSCYGIMLAAAAGATVVATSSSDDKLEIARKLGAKHLINYSKTPEWESEVLKVTDGKGVGLALDVVGAESIEQTLKCTAFAGLICFVGMLSKDPTKSVNIAGDILFGAKTLRGMLGAGSREHAIEMAAFMERHNLHPPIAQAFDFEQADKALDALTNLTAPGKIVVRC